MEPRQRVGGRRDHTPFDAPEIRAAGFASSIFRSGSWALLMMLIEKEVCTIGIKPRTLVSTYDGVHQLGNQNGRPALYYPDYGIQQRSPATKRGVASCEN